MFSVVVAGLTEAVLELSLFGLYAVLFAAVIYLFRHGLLLSKKRPNLLESAIVLQFVIITAVSATFSVLVLARNDHRSTALDHHHLPHVLLHDRRLEGPQGVLSRYKCTSLGRKHFPLRRDRRCYESARGAQDTSILSRPIPDRVSLDSSNVRYMGAQIQSGDRPTPAHPGSNRCADSTQI